VRPRTLVVAVGVALAFAAPASAATSASTAALQVALRAKGFYPGAVDGIAGPMTKRGVITLQRARGIAPDGVVGMRTRRALGPLGSPLLGQRQLAVGALGWDVSVLEFRLAHHGFRPGVVDGRFTRTTAAALRGYQAAKRLAVDGIAGPRTIKSIVHERATPRPVRLVHVVRPGESFFSIAQRYHSSPWLLARENRLRLTGVIVPGQRLRLPAGATRVQPTPNDPPRSTVRDALTHWASVYGVDPALARALAWMESGFQQDVVSSVGAVGVMQLLPETWRWVDAQLLGAQTPRTAEGNVRAGVRYLRWQLDEFRGDRRLALAGWYQGARAVREIGLYDDTKQFVSVVLALYGTV
jgi:peptidoglycan hydrolase-like protein with peptidoglycan-binding domain